MLFVSLLSLPILQRLLLTPHQQKCNNCKSFICFHFSCPDDFLADSNRDTNLHLRRQGEANQIEKVKALLLLRILCMYPWVMVWIDFHIQPRFDSWVICQFVVVCEFLVNHLRSNVDLLSNQLLAGSTFAIVSCLRLLLIPYFLEQLQRYLSRFFMSPE